MLICINELLLGERFSLPGGAFVLQSIPWRHSNCSCGTQGCTMPLDAEARGSPPSPPGRSEWTYSNSFDCPWVASQELLLGVFGVWGPTGFKSINNPHRGNSALGPAHTWKQSQQSQQTRLFRA